jgi:hypothetical protein
MTTAPRYSFSDLSPDQVRLLMQAAHVERAQAIRSWFASLFHRRRKAGDWAHGEAPGLSVHSCG